MHHVWFGVLLHWNHVGSSHFPLELGSIALSLLSAQPWLVFALIFPQDLIDAHSPLQWPKHLVRPGKHGFPLHKEKFSQYFVLIVSGPNCWISTIPWYLHQNNWEMHVKLSFKYPSFAQAPKLYSTGFMALLHLFNSWISLLILFCSSCLRGRGK